MTTLLLIRHALSEGNNLNVCSSQIDFPLVEQGWEQARVLADYVKQHYSIDAIYSSDLCRALQTAQPMADALDLEVQTDPDLREAFAGELQGMHWDRLMNEYKEVFDAWQALTKGVYPLLPKGAETYEVLAGRMEQALKRIVLQNPERGVMVVSHARALRTLLDSWQDRDPLIKEFFSPWKGIGSTSITELVFENDGSLCRAERVGFMGHLIPEQATQAAE